VRAQRFSIVLALAVFSGCNTAQPNAITPTLPSADVDPYYNASSSAFPYGLRRRAAPASRYASAPGLQRRAGADALLYVALANDNGGTVDTFAYGSTKLLGSLTGFALPQSLCTDRAQNVYVVDRERYQITEYAHGGSKPLKILVDPSGSPLGCSVDPTTGNLAVSSFEGFGGTGGILIYKNARGVPTAYVDPALYYYWFPAYDDLGNLFVDGEVHAANAVGIAELPKGRTKFVNLTLDQTIGYPGGVQWDGTNLAVGDQTLDANAIDRFAITGSKATLVGTTDLEDAQDVFQFWISSEADRQHRRVIGADNGDGHGNFSAVDYWKYPAGGAPIDTIGNVPWASGVTVSLPPAPRTEIDRAWRATSAKTDGGSSPSD
jgi:hypothetical protein